MRAGQTAIIRYVCVCVCVCVGVCVSMFGCVSVCVRGKRGYSGIIPCFYFILIVLLRIPTAIDRNQRIQIPSHTLFVHDFAAIGSSSFDPHAHFLSIRLSEPGGYIGSR